VRELVQTSMAMKNTINGINRAHRLLEELIWHQIKRNVRCFSEWTQRENFPDASYRSEVYQTKCH